MYSRASHGGMSKMSLYSIGLVRRLLANRFTALAQRQLSFKACPHLFPRTKQAILFLETKSSVSETGVDRPL